MNHLYKKNGTSQYVKHRFVVQVFFFFLPIETEGSEGTDAETLDRKRTSGGGTFFNPVNQKGVFGSFSTSICQ